jgi:uncharacterized protein (DUF302 family)
MKTMLITLISILIISTPVFAAEGMIDIESTFTVTETASRLEEVLNEKGMTIFARISHSDGARKAGIDLAETEIIIFGNPKAGSPLMKCQQTVAIDLPQKALIWKDMDGKVWLSYNATSYLDKRHNIKGCEEPLKKVAQALAGIAKAATSK